ncbi:Chromatin-remodeling complexes subunit NGG1 [Nakaseomyces bracarensis]|uniref:Chromatin-remodeling complexes subunit NGG1 n=1 Tax=Nakaseomyces bracarensis TaxID=273131 RepID=A0ABR4NT50_9SACH
MPRSTRRGKKREPTGKKVPPPAGKQMPAEIPTVVPRVAMGKGIERDDGRKVMALASTPATVLNKVLNVLDLTFERDIGMLNGQYVRKVPDSTILSKLKDELEKIHHLFNHISESDQASIDLVRQIRDDRKLKKLKKEEEARELARKAEEEKIKKQTELDAVKLEEENKKKEEKEEKEEKPSNDELDINKAKSEDIEEDINPVQKITTDNEAVVNEKENGAKKTTEEDTTNMDEKQAGTENETDNVDKKEASEGNLEKKRKAEDIENKEESVADDSVKSQADDGEPQAKKIKIEIPGEIETETPGDTTTNPESKDEIDIDKMENDPTVKNPKSEFVVSQTLPSAAAALGLFSEEGLECTGEEFLKKKYSVASYPTTDLKDMLPGELPDMDFSCPKPTNQIQYNTFLTSVEKFYREFSDNDIGFLEGKYILPSNLQVDSTYDPEVTPYIIPKLGQLYTEVWSKEDNDKNIGNTSPPIVSDPSSILPKKSPSSLNDSALESEDISCGPLVSRLISAILKENIQQSTDDISTPGFHSDDHKTSIDIKEENEDKLDLPTVADTTGNTNESNYDTAMTNMDTMENPDTVNSEADPLSKGTISTLPPGNGWKINDVNIDYPTFEERLKRELKYVGIYMNLPKDENNPNGDDPDWLNGREDDEISAELRQLQSTLKQVNKRNQLRKKTLIPLVEKQLAWQEYASILDDLNKQLDQAYIKRIRVPKKRRKHHGNVTSASASQLAQQKAANSSLKALLEKRQRWITKIGPLFNSPELMKRLPKESVFASLETQDDDDDDIDVFAQNNINKEDDLED